MKLSFMFSARCNAACRHCSTSCGPQRTETLEREQIITLMDQAARLPRVGPLRFGITGGEPFLDFELLVDIVAHGAGLGAQMSCITNGAWASSDEKADVMIQRLKQAGLLLLTFSTSSFHQKFVPLRRVERALRSAASHGLQTALKYVRAANDSQNEIAIGEWARSHGAAQVDIVPLLPTIRAGERIEEDELSLASALPVSPCPGLLETVDWNGEIYCCATPGAFNSFFSLGNIRDSALPDIHRRFYLGGLQRILREHGPSYFLPAIEAAGLQDQLRPSYGGVCDLCTHIGSNPSLRAVAEQAVRDYEVAALTSLLDQLLPCAQDT